MLYFQVLNKPSKHNSILFGNSTKNTHHFLDVKLTLEMTRMLTFTLKKTRERLAIAREIHLSIYLILSHFSSLHTHVCRETHIHSPKAEAICLKNAKTI